MELGIDIRDRETALRVTADWNSSKPQDNFYDPSLKTEMMLAILRQWKVNGIMLHLNRGCEGGSCGIMLHLNRGCEGGSCGLMQTREELVASGAPVTTFEGSMADESEFDEPRTRSRMEAFMETLGFDKLEE